MTLPVDDTIRDRGLAHLEIIRKRIEAVSPGKTTATTRPISKSLYDGLVDYIGRMPTVSVTRRLQFDKSGFRISFTRKAD